MNFWHVWRPFFGRILKESVISSVVANILFYRFVHFTQYLCPAPLPMKTPSALAEANSDPKVSTILFFFHGPSTSTVNWIAELPCFSSYHKSDNSRGKRWICAFRCHTVCWDSRMKSKWYSSVSAAACAAKTRDFAACAASGPGCSGINNQQNNYFLFYFKPF